MTYIIAYTLKLKQEETDKTNKPLFVDKWMALRLTDGYTEEDIKKIYDNLVEIDGGVEMYSLYTIAMAKVIQSTDY